ncbi:FecR domain-containing protein [Limibacter armeniacum]|uniref:FecR family protein n=1 Tax=Limibacter armeniacum TaxID=466084 RepID=UPI002FE57C62
MEEMDQEILHKWLEGTLSEEERQAFEQTDTFAELTKLSEAAKVLKAPAFDTEAELQRINARIRERRATSKTVPFRGWKNIVTGVAAAIAILLLGYAFIFNNASSTFETVAQQKQEIQLPDNSIVTLNTQSKLAFNKDTWNEHRTVELEGEAFFKVEKGATFDVVTPLGNVTVVGTQFNVNQREGYFEVICYEGKVQVKSGQETILLTPSQSFRLLNGKVILSQNTTDKSPAWLENQSNFQSMPLRYVLSELERQYDIEVQAKSLDPELLFTGAFTHDDLKLAVASIATPLGLDYKVTDNQVVIFADVSQ